jgi:hypothetical protein
MVLDNRESLLYEIKNIIDELWMEVASNFLLKEMLPIFCEITGFEGVTNAYLSASQVATALSHSTFAEMKKIFSTSKLKTEFPSVVFFPSNIASTSRLMTVS